MFPQPIKMTTLFKDFHRMSHKSCHKPLQRRLSRSNDWTIIESESRVSVHTFLLHIRPKSDFLLSLERVQSKVFFYNSVFALVRDWICKKSKQIKRSRPLLDLHFAFYFCRLSFIHCDHATLISLFYFIFFFNRMHHFVPYLCFIRCMWLPWVLIYL